MIEKEKEFWRIMRRWRQFEGAVWHEFGVFPIRIYGDAAKQAKKVASNMVDIYECKVQHVKVVGGVETILSEETIERTR